jgi:hypothetical protein
MLGAIAPFAYEMTVVAPPRHFGQLLGVFVTLCRS